MLDRLGVEENVGMQVSGLGIHGLGLQGLGPQGQFRAYKS